MDEEYLIAPVDPNRQERNEYSKHLRRKIIDESVYGVIPDHSNPEDVGRQAAPRAEKNKSPIVGDLLDNGHGFGVTTAPGVKDTYKACQLPGCGNALLFEIKPCQGSKLPWLPRETRMVGVPDYFDGSPLPWWSADRLFCVCKTCRELTSYVQGGNKVGNTRKYCGDKCQKAAARSRSKKQAPVVSQPIRTIDDVHPELYEMLHRGLKDRANRQGKPMPTEFDVLAVAEMARKNGLNVSQLM